MGLSIDKLSFIFFPLILTIMELDTLPLIDVIVEVTLIVFDFAVALQKLVVNPLTIKNDTFHGLRLVSELLTSAIAHEVIMLAYIVFTSGMIMNLDLILKFESGCHQLLLCI